MVGRFDTRVERRGGHPLSWLVGGCSRRVPTEVSLPDLNEVEHPLERAGERSDRGAYPETKSTNASPPQLDQWSFT